MNIAQPNTSIHPALDLARFDLFLNVFVRTPGRPSRRRVTRKRGS